MTECNHTPSPVHLKGQRDPAPSKVISLQLDNLKGGVLLAARAETRKPNADEIRIPRYPRRGWIGVDLDGTLAYTISPSRSSAIGEPIPLMLRRVRYWIETGRTVKIFTARASCSQQVSMIRSWCARHGIPGLEITNIKDHRMIALWDDRAVGVVTDLGLPILRPRRSIWLRVRWLVGLITTTVFPFKCQYHGAESLMGAPRHRENGS